MPYGSERFVAVAQGIEVELERTHESAPLEFLDDLVRYAYARLGSLEEAEDVAIEVLQDAVCRKGGVQGLRQPRLYLLGMARRKIANHLRKNRKERGPATLTLEDISNVVPSQRPIGETAAVREVLSKLPDVYQEVLLLKYVHGLTAEEIAQVIGKSRSAARSLVQRARDAFAELGAHLAEPRA